MKKVEASIPRIAPVKKAAKVETVTLRHLYTHTTDIPWVGESGDFEESAPLYVPYARIGERFEYNSVGPALARRVLETVCDESVASLYQRTPMPRMELMSFSATSGGGSILLKHSSLK